MFSGKRRHRLATIWAVATVIVFVGGVIAFSLGGFFSGRDTQNDQSPPQGQPDQSAWGEMYDITVVRGDSSTRLVIGTHNGFKFSDNAGLTWQDGQGPVAGLDVMAVDSLEGELLFAGGANFLGIIQSPDGGDTWYRSLEGLPQDKGWLIAVTAWSALDSDGNPTANLVAWGPEVGLYESHDMASTWTEFPVQFGAQDYVFQLLHVSGPPETVFAATEKGLFRTVRQDDGSWTQFERDAAFGEEAVTAVDVDPGSGRLYAGTSTDLYYSDDGGSTWETMTTLGAGVKALAHDPEQTQVIYLITGDDTLLRSLDSGESWEKVR